MKRALVVSVSVAAIVVLAAAVLGCGDDALGLTVDLKTDLVPGIEFTTIRTEVQDGAGAARGSEDHGAFATDSYVMARRVAEVGGLSVGDYAVRVRLLTPSGAPVVERLVRVTARRNVALTVLITRDCRGVACPQAGDSPSATACLGGRCVDPTCSSEQPELCGTDECMRDDQCMPLAACASGTCESGTCIFAPAPDACGPGLWCNPETGCLPLPSADAGVSFDAGPRLDAGCMSDPQCDDGNFCNGAEHCVAGACVEGGPVPACDDGNPCNGVETCVPGGCVPGTALSCDDGVVCTVDACVASGCTHTPMDALCTAAPGGTCDASLDCQYSTCTAATCVAGPCQTAMCMGPTCVRTSVCVAAEMCCGGTCAPIGCSDGNPCTDDSCGGSGCMHANNARACDDGDPCTDGDLCTGGTCLGGAPRVCLAPECGTAECVGGMCVFTSAPERTPCEDGNLCTGFDSCMGGTCVPGAAVICMVPLTCNPASGICE